MWNTMSALVVMLALHPNGAADDRTPASAVVRAAADAGATTDRPFTRLVPNLAKDIGALPSRTTLLVLLAGTAGSAAASASDESARLWAVRTGSSTMTRVGAAAGDGWV